MKKTFLALGIVLGFSLTWDSCKKETTPEPVQKPSDSTNNNSIDPTEIRLNPNTFIVSETINNELMNISDNEIKFSASANTADLANIQVGSLLASGIHANAPYGYLRKVTAVLKDNNYTFATEDVSLSEVVEQGDLNGEQPYADNGSNHISFSINEILYDADGNNYTTNDQVKLMGSLALIPTLKIEADWQFPYTLKRIKVGYKMERISNLQLVGQTALPQDYQVEVTVMDKPLPPIEFFIGSLPVVVTSNVVLKAGINASGEVLFNVDFNETSTVESYVEKPSGVALNDFQNWVTSTTKTQNSNINENSLLDYYLNFNGDLPYITADLDFFLYNSSNIKTGLGAEAALNVSALCSTGNGCNFDIDLKLKGCFDLRLKLFNLDFVNNTICPYENQFDIWETASNGGSNIGCTDSNSPNYNANVTSDDGSCQYAYIQNVELINFNPQNNGSDWDNGTGATVNPDIIVQIKKTNDANWLIETNAADDCNSTNLPYSYNTGSGIMLTDESWTIEFSDEDLYFNDLMGSATFNPIDMIRVNNSTSYLDVSNNGNTARIYFNIQ